MKLHVTAIALLACACLPAHAQMFDQDQRGAYLSAQWGNGRIYGDNATGYKQMRWRAFEVRGGRDLNPKIVGEDTLTGKATSRIDFVYYNEGHPDNNHRDGFAFQFTYTRKLSDLFTGELSAGPYSSMNTTTINGVQIDQARYGMLYSAALLFPIDRWIRGAHVRLGYNHVAMRDVFRSDAVMLGIGSHFTKVPPFPETELSRSRLWLGASYGRSFTSHAGTQDANGATVEAKQYGGKWALSFRAVFEGDDRTRVDRRGIAGQFWFVQPLTERWSIQAGLGPYFAENRREGNRTAVHGLITFQFERNLSEKSKAFFAFHRVKSFQEMNDRDLFHLGLLKTFGA